MNDVQTQEEEIEKVLGTTRSTLLRDRSQSPTRQEKRNALQAKMTSLQMGWSKLQWECEGRNTRLIQIHQMLHNYERAVQPFMVNNNIYVFIFV